MSRSPLLAFPHSFSQNPEKQNIHYEYVTQEATQPSLPSKIFLTVRLRGTGTKTKKENFHLGRRRFSV